MEVSLSLSENTKPSKLRPSDICFSQKVVYHRFRRRSGHGHMTIGDTLDDIMEGRLSMTSLPEISLKQEEDEETDGDILVGGKKTRWITADNRRLWIFRHLERLGRCKEISFQEVSYIDSMKRSSENRGVSVGIKDDAEPGGYWHKAPDVTHIDPMSVKFTKDVIPMTFSSGDHSGVNVRTLVNELVSENLECRNIPPIVVWQDETAMSVIDGNRRLWAFQKSTKSEIAAIVIEDRQLLDNTMPRMIGKSLNDLSSVYDHTEVITE
ncbi:uncharacterized protein LOC110451200 [Mizuhopecten yessoensis]|uniref:Uncharacterized protein n=1 Tax=Mizuhopecten yessoensis TaxID=6573 RepID=A0A210QM13_MIZYE|nr:uncharacterized protein LOC110451200 [Mizuhopecten yessoensis]OWF49778.1 hypothetical protein KP79_PYT05693 [Mizuhopecten yessoensis]